MTSHIEPASLAATQDLTSLEELSSETICEALAARYAHDDIYTYVGDILVALNPFRNIGIYSEAAHANYTHTAGRDLAPHIFALADRAYSSLVSQNQSQVCVISGESGAGKTETSKYFLQHVIYLANHQRPGAAAFHDIHHRISQTSPILEAFGNASTSANANSSRFGKYLELKFDANCVLVGATLRHYLLEHSRTVAGVTGERNYHVFYYMYAGLSASERAQLELPDPNLHRFFGDEVPRLDDPEAAKAWQNLQKSLHDVGLTQHAVHELQRILAAVLHTGDIVIEQDSNDDAQFDNVATVGRIASLLGVTLGSLAEALLKARIHIRGETYHRPHTQHEAELVVDALAKALYGHLFAWLMQNLDTLLTPTQPATRTDLGIGILDIFGFENFERNSLEQLMINFANERLQFYFNEVKLCDMCIVLHECSRMYALNIFSNELQDLQAEGIGIDDLQFQDNLPTLLLFYGNKPQPGLLQLLDEESRFTSATDETLVVKLNNILGSDPVYLTCKHADRFGVRHFAGTITYDVHGFLAKNRDPLSPAMLEVLASGSNVVLEDMFGLGSDKFANESLPQSRAVSRQKRRSSSAALLLPAPGRRSGRASQSGSRYDLLPSQPSQTRLSNGSNEVGTRRGSAISLLNLMRPRRSSYNITTAPPPVAETASATRRHLQASGSTTLSGRFATSLDELIERMQRCNPHFVRCIRSNAACEAKVFERALVLKQLNYTGVLETTRIRREGYSHRIVFADFVRRYRHIGFAHTTHVKANPEACRVILQAAEQFLRTQNEQAEQQKRRALAMTFFQEMRGVSKVIFQSLVALADADGERVSLVQARASAHRDRQRHKAINKFDRKDFFKSIHKSRRDVEGWWLRHEHPLGNHCDAEFQVYSWFHGLLDRTGADLLLEDTEDGTFLVRVCQAYHGYALAMRTPTRTQHFKIELNTTTHCYAVSGHPELSFDSLNKLIQHFKQQPIGNFELKAALACQHPYQLGDLDVRICNGVDTSLTPQSVAKARPKPVIDIQVETSLPTPPQPSPRPSLAKTEPVVQNTLTTSVPTPGPNFRPESEYQVPVGVGSPPSATTPPPAVTPPIPGPVSTLPGINLLAVGGVSTPPNVDVRQLRALGGIIEFDPSKYQAAGPPMPETMYLDTSCPKPQWLRGRISRFDAERELRHRMHLDGIFLVREKAVTETQAVFALSLVYGRQIEHHLVIKTRDGPWLLDNYPTEQMGNLNQFVDALSTVKDPGLICLLRPLLWSLPPSTHSRSSFASDVPMSGIPSPDSPAASRALPSIPHEAVAGEPLGISIMPSLSAFDRYSTEQVVQWLNMHDLHRFAGQVRRKHITGHRLRNMSDTALAELFGDDDSLLHIVELFSRMANQHDSESPPVPAPRLSLGVNSNGSTSSTAARASAQERRSTILTTQQPHVFVPKRGFLRAHPAVRLRRMCRKGNLRGIEKWLSHFPNMDVDSIEQEGDWKTPLFVAAENGHLEVVKLLLARGANPFKLSQHRLTAMRAALNNNFTTVASVLRDAMQAERAALLPPPPVPKRTSLAEGMPTRQPARPWSSTESADDCYVAPHSVSTIMERKEEEEATSRLSSPVPPSPPVRNSVGRPMSRESNKSALALVQNSGSRLSIPSSSAPSDGTASRRMSRDLRTPPVVPPRRRRRSSNSATPAESPAHSPVPPSKNDLRLPTVAARPFNASDSEVNKPCLSDPIPPSLGLGASSFLSNSVPSVPPRVAGMMGAPDDCTRDSGYVDTREARAASRQASLP
ncbi:uncharacterized protein MONBRDRAFT_25921 [Monosiga brevicollis MX1]|uniref:Uncharacterized protein n=1 Tax=Monosiga brevicollis TaxID=81824 RepID=A9V0V2_MONBE|nr:uncharacterized protein MONBRDRAFT_25921 [Monosiga brevicollis MX1]EDQ88700.1 predicted protein [Monosiga brevicollis MX1]|eukprot:XP_001746313.1 hypothetical protein [Monosiga brevicollis MX1]